MRFMKYLSLILVGLCATAQAATVKYNEKLANESGVAVAKTYALPLNGYGIDWFSYQAIWSSAAPTAVTFTDGSVSTTSVTITSNTALSTGTASDFLTVLTTQTIPAASSITVNGIPLILNVHWYQDQTSTMTTAISIKQAVNSYVSGVTASTGTAAKVTITANQYGTFGNNMTLVSNTSSVTVNTANFTGGRNYATYTINGVELQANRDFTIGASSGATATSLAAAIRNNATLATIVTSSAPSANPGVVYTTATSVGSFTNYVVTSSTQTALTIAGVVTTSNGMGTGAMTGGTNSAYTINDSTINVANVFAPTGRTPMVALPVLYSTGSSVAIGGLTNQTTYYVIPINSLSFKLASSTANAVAGTAIVFTSSQTKSTADNFTLTPLAYTGTPAGLWQASNDGVSWSTLTTASSITFNTVFPSTNTAADFGQIDYSWIRFNLQTPPTAGGMDLQIIGNGKNNK